MALILRSEIGRRLTVPEIDGNFTYLENLSMGLTESRPYQSVELTYTQALALLASEGVVDGKRYLITEFDVELYGGTDILVSGLPNNKFSTSGYGKFYNPNYGSMSVWNPSATYSIDDLSIYGGKVWKNLTGSLGEPDDVFVLDNNWELQEDYTNIEHYLVQWDQIELGFAEGDYCINSRYDSYRNNYVRVGQLNDPALGGDRWFFCGVNPIAAFGWGNDNINDCDIKDSYFNCLNIMGSTTVYGVKMSNYSFVFQSVLIDSEVEGLVFENESGAYELYMINSQFINCIFSNNSYINGLFDNTFVSHLNLSNDSSIGSTIYSSTIEYLNLSNYSSINITATASSFLSYIDLSGESYINNIDLYDSRFQYINLNNISYINSISASASYFKNVNMTNESWISDIILSNDSYFERVDTSNRSYIVNAHLNNSSMYEINLNNYSYIEGWNNTNSSIELWNYSTMNYLSLDNHSRISGVIGLTDSSYFKRINMTNRSRIQGPIDFKNNSRLEKLDATNDSYITDLSFNNNSYIENLDISGSIFQNIGLSASSLYQIDLKAAYLDLAALGTFSRTFPSGTSFRFNELKYQFDLTFNGSSGYGLTNNALNIPAMLIPYDFYIEKVIIESSTLVYSGSSATFSFTMPGGLSPSTVEIAVSEMSDRIKVLDISNGLITGTKADSDKMLMAFLTGGTSITSGGIKMEVTLKNTKYFND